MRRERRVRPLGNMTRARGGLPFDAWMYPRGEAAGGDRLGCEEILCSHTAGPASAEFG